MTTLDFDSREQLYYQLYNLLFQKITDGSLKIGDLIPSESEIIERYGVSRATARKSMEMLSNNGFVKKKRGIGTVVISNRPNNSPQKVIKYSRKNLNEGVIPVKKVIDLSVIKAPEEVAKALNLANNIDVYRLTRVRYGDNKPYYLEINYYERAFVPELENRDLSKESLRVFLSQNYNINWKYTNQKIYSIVSNEEISNILEIEVGTPLLYIKRVSYDNQDTPREYLDSYYIAEYYNLEIDMAI